jgi:hypothetical protein
MAAGRGVEPDRRRASTAVRVADLAARISTVIV